MALLGTGTRLASLRRKVLLVDADLEAPGLTLALLKEKEREQAEGFVEVCTELLGFLDRHRRGPQRLPEKWHLPFVEHVKGLIKRLPPPPPQNADLEASIRREFEDSADSRFGYDCGALDFLPMGQVVGRYAATVARLPIAESFDQVLDPKVVTSLGFRFKNQKSKGTLGELLASALKLILREVTALDGQVYDYVLVDSRTGLADVAGFCLKWLSHHIVLVTGLNVQNVDGTALVLREHLRQCAERVILVFSPVPEAEITLRSERKERALQQLQQAAPGLDVKNPIELFYHPRAALLEENYLDDNLAHTLLAHGYDRLSRVLRDMHQDTVKHLFGAGLRELRGGKTEKALRFFINSLLTDRNETELGLRALILPFLNEGQTTPGLLEVARLWGTISIEHQGIVAEAFGEVAVNAIKTVDKKAPDLIERMEKGFKRLLEMETRKERAFTAFADAQARVATVIWDQDPKEARTLYQQAFQKYAQAVEIKPDKHETFNNWGNHLGNLAGRLWDQDPKEARTLYQQAFQKYAQAVKIKPDKHETFHNWGSALGSLAGRLWDQDPKEARTLYQQAFQKYAQAVEIKPDKHDTFNNWGSDLGSLAGRLWDQDPKEARTLYQQAFDKSRQARQMAPKAVSYRAAYAWLLTQMSLRDKSDCLKRLSEARVLIEDAVELEPRDRRHRTVLCVCLRTLARHETKSRQAKRRLALEAPGTYQLARHETKSRQAKLNVALKKATLALLKLCPGLTRTQLENFLLEVESGRLPTLDPKGQGL
ncbi:MAG: hypothetical protein HYU36_00650 [Planctomycetes bacterium]|nr:hypothetical protein [Planctomycetota bacterium]